MKDKNGTIHKPGFTLKRKTVKQTISAYLCELVKKAGKQDTFWQGLLQNTIYINSKITEFKSYDKIFLAKNIMKHGVTTSATR